jgi:hypothetical protein
MAGRTPNFGLGYFDFKDSLDSSLSVDLEVNRFSTIDSQLFGLYSIFGNGIVEGLIVSIPGGSQNPFSLNVSSGIYFINGKSIQLDFEKNIPEISSNSILYVYAGFTRTLNSPIVANVFISNLSSAEGAVRLAQVKTGNSTITSIDLSYRQEISFRQLIIDEIAKHKHRGDPDKIDLLREVKNSLPGARISDLDTAKIKRGVFKKERIPKLNHNDLINKGFINHAGLETFVRTMPDRNRQLLGEVAAVNLMKQSFVSVKNDRSIANEMINSIIVSPGYTDNSIIDLENSTAVINFDSGCITGIPEEVNTISLIKYTTLGAFQSYTQINNITFSMGIPIPPIGSGDISPPPLDDSSSEVEAYITPISSSSFLGGGSGDGGGSGGGGAAFKDSFENASSSGGYPGLFIETQSIPSSTTFGASSDNTLRTDGIYSVKFRGGKKEKLIFKRSVVINKNWSNYASINIDVRCKSVEHPAVYFYFYNKNEADQLEQSDIYVLLSQNEITSNGNSSMQDFTEKSFEIASSDRNNVDSIVFEVADVETDFVFNIDDIFISGFLSGGGGSGGGSTIITQSYNSDGLLVYRYESTNLINLNSISFETVIPEGTSIEFRWRAGNNVLSIASEQFSDPVLSEQSILAVGRVFDIQISFKAKEDTENQGVFIDTPVLKGFTLQISSSGEFAGFNVAKVNQWMNGKGDNVKIDPTLFDLGDLTIKTPLEINSFFYATENSVQKSLPDFISYFGYSGTNLPISPIQALEIDATDGRVGLDTPTSAVRLSNKNMIICDTYNDRVIEIDKSGNVIRGFGSHNVASSSSNVGLFPMSAIFNPRTKILQIVFNSEFNVDPNTFELNSIKLYSNNITSSLSVLDSVEATGITKKILSIKLSPGKIDFINSTTSDIFVKLTPAGFGQTGGFFNNETFRRLYSLDGLKLFVGDFTYVSNIRHPINAIKSYNNKIWICNSNILFDRIRAGLRNDNDEFFVALNSELKFNLVVSIDPSLASQDCKITFINDTTTAGSSYQPVLITGPIVYNEPVIVTTKSRTIAEVRTFPINLAYIVNPEGTTFLFTFKIKVEVRNQQNDQYEEIAQSPFFVQKRITVLENVQAGSDNVPPVPSVILLNPETNQIDFNYGDETSFTFSDYTLGSIQELDRDLIIIGGLQRFSSDQSPPVEIDDPDSFKGQAIEKLKNYRGRVVIYNLSTNSFVYSYDSSDGVYVSDVSRINGGDLSGSYLIVESSIMSNGGRVIVIDRFNNIIREINTGEYTIINDARLLANGNFLLST